MNQPVLKPPEEVRPATPAEAPRSAADQPPTFDLANTLVTISEPAKAQAESIRVLRTHIMAQHVDQGRRALSVCAVSPGAGCSFLAANLAVALSQVGVTTLLIDGDLRSPSLENYIRPSQPLPGLRQCLAAEDGAFNEFIQQDVLPSLSVMYSGGIPGNPQELLAGERFKTLMDHCLRDFQMTIIDTPPAMSCADARRVSSVVGYSVVVARQHESRITDIGTLISQLQQDGARVIGTVLREA
ncbi:CpsD/CapB family tyrosine-protein kinase [Phenylobacterium sp.]|uniref:CpsD/CapB family tyrosine-protein kinase n=1 Tax=Phenylobacterium sp. TaxID=1871053 RepID=UPI002735A37F|nr:CpsD/CapB family tyrosine-protein kinase [Phenylobacterium sp.]MDP3854024.1 CpsD/CapB family tyrosine-protein kinase [Phenylobacterium sp.]